MNVAGVTMTSSRRFAVFLAVFVLVFFAYGLCRLGLGVDFTDEGAYVAWPLRTLYGEPPFAGDPLLLWRPMFNHLSALYRIHPGISLYELRLCGWILHLAAFSALSICLFRLTGAGVQSLLIASVPFFVCHIFGLAPPSYNSVSSDCLLISLSLLGLAAHGNTRRPLALHLAGWLALFIATVAHPALGLVAATLGLNEAFRHHLVGNLLRLRPTASNAGFLLFASCWLVYFAQSVATGAMVTWLERSALFRASRVTSLEGGASSFLARLLSYPFSYDAAAIGFSIATLLAILLLAVLARTGRRVAAANAVYGLTLVLVIAIIRTYRFNPEHLPVAFVMVAFAMSAMLGLRLGAPVIPVEPDLRWLIAASVLGALLYATLTYYFSPLRSWTSGVLGLPFAFAIGFGLLLKAQPQPSTVLRALIPISLVLAVTCVARDHYSYIERDAAPSQLTTQFHVPKLRHIRSTPERVQAVDDLYDYLHPRLARGETLLAFDNCPLLYFLLDTKPGYGLTWAVRYTQSPAALRQFDQELNSRPLPRYAIRTVVNLANPIWSIAPRTSYDDYPLNATLLAHYGLEKTIFPFEIWRLEPTTLHP